MEDVKISIIIPVYNKAPFLKRCLDSVVNQTVKPYEVILIDDGSTDDGRRMCNEYASLHAGDHWIVVHTDNNGVSSARNLGLTLVRGDYVSFMDADDAYTLNAIEPMPNGIEPRYDGTITSKIKEVEDAHMGERQEWTNNLRHLRETLQKDGNPEQNYAIHEPLLVNRRKMREVLEKYPNEPMVRALYGNYWQIGGVQDPDPKLAHQHYAELDEMLAGMDVVSTSDESFHHGNVGEWLRKRFDNKSKYEKE